MDPITAIGIIASVQQLLAALGKTLILMNQAYSDFKGAEQEAQRLRNELNTSVTLVTQVWVALVDIDPSTRASLDRTAQDFSETIERLRKRIQPPEVKGIKRFAWPLKRDETNKLASEIANFRNTFHLALGVRVSMNVEEIKEGIGDVREHQRVSEQAEKAAKRGTILDWLYGDLPDSKLESLRKARAQNSGSWFLRHPLFESWVHGESSSNILFCPGIPGAGKTVLTSVVIDYLNDYCESRTKNKYAAIHSFFDYKERTVQTEVMLLKKLLWQILIQFDFLHPPVESLYDTCVERKRNPTTNSLIELINSVTIEMASVFVIFDGVDECSPEMQDFIIQLLEALRKTCFKIFVTSRPHLQRIPKDAAVIKIRADSADIADYITQRLSHLKNIDLRDIIFKKLTEKENDVFLLVRFQVDHVLLPKNKSPRRIKADLQNIPTELNELYFDVMDRIDKGGYQEDAILTLSWLFHTPVPMTMQLLRVGVAVEDGDVDVEEADLQDPESLIECCHGLVIFNPDSQIVQFSHYTVQEFLKTHPRLLPAAVIAETLIACLKSRPPERVDSTKQTLIDPLTEYARVHWGSFTRGEGESSTVIRKFIFANQQSLGSDPYGETLLHLFARKGLAQLCTVAVNEDEIYPGLRATSHKTKEKDSRYVYVGNVTSVTPKGKTALHCAAEGGHAGVVAILLGAGADVELSDTDIPPTTPLQYAIASGNVETVEAVLSGGAKATKILYYAFEWHNRGKAGMEEIIKSLIKAGADVNDSAKGRPVILTAIEHGTPESVRIIIKAGAKVPETALHLAATRERNSTNTLRILLEMGVDIETRSENGETALHEAASSGSFRSVEFLIKSGANVMRTSNNGSTPLHFALGRREGNSGLPIVLGREPERHDILMALKQAGADIEARTNIGTTLLHNAVQHSTVQMVQTLLASGASILTESNDGRNPLHFVAYNQRDSDMIKFVLGLGSISVDSRATDGSVPLHYAAEGLSSVVVLKALLEAGSDVNAQRPDGSTALHLAVMNSRSVHARALVKAGIDVKARCEDGSTALHIAAAVGDGSIISLLLKAGADANCRTNDGSTALHYIVKNFKTQNLDLLLRAGADINARRTNGSTVMHLACANTFSWCISTLITRGGDVYATMSDGSTALHAASLNENGEVIKFLCKMGLDVNARDEVGRTPLHIAISSDGNSINAVETLLKRGADPNIRDNDGLATIDICIREAKYEFMGSLLERGAMVDREKYNWAEISEAISSRGLLKLLKQLQKAGIQIDNP